MVMNTLRDTIANTEFETLRKRRAKRIKNL